MSMLGVSAPVVAGVVAGVLVLAGLAAGLVAKHLAPGEPDEEEREQKGPDQRRRRLLLGAGAGAAAITVTAVAFPAARRLSAATDRLRRTAWADGVRVVDADGTLIRAEQVQFGELLTVYPDGAVGAVDAQAVLIREEVARFVDDPERRDWVHDGIAIYSKLCTHMACPLGLYQQQSGTLLCPCHQAVFDLLDGGRALQGPARRALPQLPVQVDPEGVLVARGDFSDAVGTGFWGRP
jgi:ubiquinol-cytochrome c reductase iron-sulfur subunit